MNEAQGEADANLTDAEVLFGDQSIHEYDCKDCGDDDNPW